MSSVLSGLSAVLDITEGHPRGHAARTCLIAMRIADALRLTPGECSDLFYGALLKDAGCLAVVAVADVADALAAFLGSGHEFRPA